VSSVPSLTTNDVAVLQVIAERPNCLTANELGPALQISDKEVTLSLARLKSRGFLQTSQINVPAESSPAEDRPDAGDAVFMVYELTHAGRSELAELMCQQLPREVVEILRSIDHSLIRIRQGQTPRSLLQLVLCIAAGVLLANTITLMLIYSGVVGVINRAGSGP
jgi:DNA-binding MarR family transcriptional regulator